MSMHDPRSILIDAVIALRSVGFTLGTSDLVAALQAVDKGWGRDSLEELKQVARLLWCHSLSENRVFDAVWTSSADTTERSPASLSLPPTISLLPDPEDETPPSRPQPEMRINVEPPSVPEERGPASEPFVPEPTQDTTELRTYWPITRRAMIYAWRHLRRPVPEGPADLLDIKATVEQAARRGFFLAPICRRRERNHAHLILMADQQGSMVPFHRFTREMIETVKYQSTLGEVDVYYFHNVPAGHVYEDPYLLKPIVLEQVYAQCSYDTSVLIVSDAGAARGRRGWDRIRATASFLVRLEQQTTLIAWLNPMPEERWPGTSAQVIAHLIKMFQVDPDSFSNAIDIIRG
jgi:uncharacterized protein with von Willebrand factor type A (vWA) domain